MMNRLFLTMLIALFTLHLHAQKSTPPKDGWKNTRKGNESFRKKDFASAEKYYREGAEKDTSKATANYNLGNALYQQKKYSEAERAYANSTSGTNRDSLSKAWHNLGNSMLEQKKYQESINAYKQALKQNPNDEETRYNLAYAQQKLKQQQPPPKQNQNQQKQNQNQNQQKQNQNQQKQNQQQQKDKDQQQNQPQDNQSMSKDEANRMLDALKDDEKKTRSRMNSNKKNQSYKRNKTKDW